MLNEETRDYWRWQMFRQVADYLHNPDDCNREKLLGLLEAYRQERFTLDALNVQECSANAI